MYYITFWLQIYIADLTTEGNWAPTSDVGVPFLSPLRNEDSDFSVPSAPEGLYSDGDPTARKDSIESMPSDSK